MSGCNARRIGHPQLFRSSMKPQLSQESRRVKRSSQNVKLPAAASSIQGEMGGRKSDPNRVWPSNLLVRDDSAIGTLNAVATKPRRPRKGQATQYGRRYARCTNGQYLHRSANSGVKYIL